MVTDSWPKKFFKRELIMGKGIIIFVTIRLLIASCMALAQENTGSG